MQLNADMIAEAVKTQPKGLELGIYFGLPENVYHNDPALSYSGMKLLNQSYLEYWDHTYNPKRKRHERTEEQTQGARLHKLLLEPDTFRDQYCVVPPDKIQDDKEWITGVDYDVIEKMANAIRELPEASQYISNGKPEVSIIFQCPETGLRCKSRHDWFRTMITTDYKSITKVTDSLMRRQMNEYGYHIQMYHYYQSRKWIKQFLYEMREYDRVNNHETCLLSDYIYADEGCMPSVEWLNRLIDEDMDDFYFMFQKKTSPYTVRILRLDDASFNDGESEVRAAKNVLIHGLATYGLDKPPASTGEVEEFSIRFGSMRTPR